jgi:hypothetical protein
LRKKNDLEVTDRIRLSLFGSAGVKAAVEANEDTLMSETLAVSWAWEERKGAWQIDCGQEPCAVFLQKVPTPD